MAQFHEHPPLPKEGEMATTDRQDPYAGDPNQDPADRSDGATTHRQNPYAGDPNQDPADRSDTAITHRENPYEGDPDRVSEDPAPEDRA
jgi:hypothetical protein